MTRMSGVLGAGADAHAHAEWTAASVGPRPALSVVVPCRDEECNLAALYERLVAACRVGVGDDFEIALVDDGSHDGTRDAIRRLNAHDGRVVGVFLSCHHGQQGALLAGLAAARGERILMIDADLQDPPELLPRMLAVMDEGVDVVYGQRTKRRGESRFKRWTAVWFYRVLARLADTAVQVDAGEFRLISRRVADVLLAMPEQHRYTRGLVSWIGFRQEPVPYERDARLAGRSSYSPCAMLRLAVDAITGFSVLPLRLASWLGLIVTGLAVPMAVHVVASWWNGVTVPGWTSVTLLILILGGVQLLMIGILGEYVGRLFVGAKQRPLYVIDEVVARRDRGAPNQPREARQTAPANDGPSS